MKLPAFLLAAAVLLIACGSGGDTTDGQAGAADPPSSGGLAEATGASGESDAANLTTPAAEDEDDAKDGGSGANPVDVCALVSQAEAAETLGLSVRQGEPSLANFDQATCTWVDVNNFGEISVEVRSGDPARFTEFYELTAGEPVDGLGDRAKWDTLYGLEVLTSEYYLGIFTINFGDEEGALRERSIDLAEKILERLP